MFGNGFFKKLVNLSSEGIIITDINGLIIFANNKALNMFVYEKKELLGQKIEILIPKDSQLEHVKLRKEYINSPNSRPHGQGLDVYAVKKDNSHFQVEVSLSVLEEGDSRYTVSIISDITKRKQKEKKIQRFIAEQQDLKNAHIKSQLEVLKNQISPHYLFNCLSILYTLIESEPNKAQLFAKKISETYGYVLETRNKKWVHLSSEISFLNNYVFLQEIRFGDKFKLTLEEGIEQENAYIIPLAIQTLIENVFKHNKLSSSKKLDISLRIKNGGVLVRNTITQKDYEKKSFGVGLENLIKQYSLVSSEVPLITTNGKTYEVWVPIFKNMIQ